MIKRSSSQTPKKNEDLSHSSYHIKRYYGLVFAIIFILAVINFGGLDALINSQESAARLINISGRQRMLSQRITLLTSQWVIEPSAPAQSIIKAELTTLITEMQSNHDALINRTLENASEKPLSDALNILYFDNDQPVDSLIDTFLAQANDILLVPHDYLSLDTPALVLLVRQSSTLLAALDRVVLQYESEKNSEVALQRLTMNALVVLLLFLGLFFFVIFNALERRIRVEEGRLRVEVADRQKAEHFVNSVAESTPDIIVVQDIIQDRNIYSNRSIQSVLGYASFEGTPAAATPHTPQLIDLVHPDDYEQVVAPYFKRFAETGEPEDIQYRVKSAEGIWHWFESRNRVFKRAKDGSSSQIITVSQDITQQKQAEIQMRLFWQEREKVKVLSDFIKAISHDLRTPLSIINTQIYLLVRSVDEAYRMAKGEAIHQQVTHITTLIDQYQFMASLDTINDLNVAEIKIPAVVHSLIMSQKKRIEPRNITIVYEPDDELCILANKKLILRAFEEVLDNAIRVTPDEGQIVLRTVAQDGMVVYEVSDRGVGITEEDIAQIFDQFYKVNQARTMDESKAGLGLCIAHKIVTLHKGRIEMESTPDVGSTFRILLPADDTTS